MNAFVDAGCAEGDVVCIAGVGLLVLSFVEPAKLVPQFSECARPLYSPAVVVHGLLYSRTVSQSMVRCPRLVRCHA